MLLGKKAAKKFAAKIFFSTNKTDFLCSFQISIFYNRQIYTLVEKQTWSTLSFIAIVWLVVNNRNNSVSVVQQSQWLSASVNNFTREPCKFGNTKKKLGRPDINCYRNWNKLQLIGSLISNYMFLHRQKLHLRLPLNYDFMLIRHARYHLSYLSLSCSSGLFSYLSFQMNWKKK